VISRTGANGTTTDTYDFENRLTTIELPNGAKTAHLYDALGRRIQKNVNNAVTNHGHQIYFSTFVLDTRA